MSRFCGNVLARFIADCRGLVRIGSIWRKRLSVAPAKRPRNFQAPTGAKQCEKVRKGATKSPGGIFTGLRRNSAFQGFAYLVIRAVFVNLFESNMRAAGIHSPAKN